METIWEDCNCIGRENDEVLNEIAAEEATCQNFQLSCCRRYSILGIWFQYDDQVLLVDPLDLVNSIYRDDTYYLLDYFITKNEEKPEGYYQVTIQKWNHCFSWRIYHTHSQAMYQMQFTYDDYLKKIKDCINTLYYEWGNGNAVAYKKFDVELEGIKFCKMQLDVAGVAPSHYKLMTKDISQEYFVFLPDNKHVEGYTIGISDRVYHTWFTHWDSDMENVRYQLENYVYNHEAEIKLNFDMDETIIKIRHVWILDVVNKAGKGYGFKYKDSDLVEIIPNDFVHMPIIKGYCEPKEAVRVLYEGLLDMAYSHPIDGKEDSITDTPSRMIAYNRYKSPIIESCLNGEKSIPNTYKIRQTLVKHIIKIDPDYDVFLWDEEGVAWDLEDLYDKNGIPIQFPELNAWAKEMSNIVVASETGDPYEKDWTDYHMRGLTLSRQLRERLSLDYDLWYEAPFEDKSGIIPRRKLII